MAGIEFLLTNDVGGAVNLTAPDPVPNAEFAAALGRVLHRPTFLPTPSFGPKLVLGEMADDLLFASKRVRPGEAEPGRVHLPPRRARTGAARRARGLSRRTEFGYFGGMRSPPSSRMTSPLM